MRYNYAIKLAAIIIDLWEHYGTSASVFLSSHVALVQ